MASSHWGPLCQTWTSALDHHQGLKPREEAVEEAEKGRGRCRASRRGGPGRRRRGWGRRTETAAEAEAAEGDLVTAGHQEAGAPRGRLDSSTGKVRPKRRESGRALHRAFPN
ncbi:Hypothetical predicted protein [Marmota monax]|uniref:Uncharacterized protein n=1 Tax=Marmota monax TaxID=9995 RepID=A0A5E4BHK1_MARMO|nr:hypothetical protein GHT09_011358 [Marmota monax]VTJ68530.1 Hypothetical predicted protein [Marmota monax]